MRLGVDRHGERAAWRRGARRRRALAVVAAGWLGLLASAGPPPAAAAGESAAAGGAAARGAAAGGAAAGGAAVTTEARQPISPRWGLGWDGRTQGLLLRYRWRDVWQFGLCAGPDDDKRRTDHLEWDSRTPGDTARAGREESRCESGRVRATAGRRFWRQEGLSVSVDFGVAYRWLHSQSVWRNPTTLSGGRLDVHNSSSTTDSGTWQVSLGLRPAYALGERFSVEWECGLVYERREERLTTIEWYDVDPAYSRHKDDNDGHSFDSYGWLGYQELKLIFWF